jgi:hypothetical protein
MLTAEVRKMTESKKPGSGRMKSKMSRVRGVAVVSILLVTMMVAVVARGGVDAPILPPDEPVEPIPEDPVLEDDFVFPKDQPVPPSASSDFRVPA